MTTFNPFIRNSWQVFNTLEVADSSTGEVLITSPTVRIWRGLDVVFMHIVGEISFTPDSAKEIPFVDLVLPGPNADAPVRIPTVLTHLRDGTLFFNTAMLEVFESTLRIYNYPFHSSRVYNVNVQLFYSP